MKPMLAKEADANRLSYPLYAQAKLDGIRCVITGGRALSRSLKEIPNREIFAELSRPELEGFDGEIVVGDPTAADAYRCTSSYVMAANKTDALWKFYIFDKHDSPLPYNLRREAVDISAPLSDRVATLQSVICQSAADLDAFEQHTVALGYEGVILRSPNARYKYGRGTVAAGDLLKLKRFIDFEAAILGVYEEMHNANEAKTNNLGRTERSSHRENKIGKDTLGGFYVEALNGPCAGATFKVGTGFSAEDRQSYWKNQETLVGLVAKIKSFPVGVKEKPRHPVFLGLRNTNIDGDTP